MKAMPKVEKVPEASQHSPAQLRPSWSEMILILTSVLSMALTTAEQAGEMTGKRSTYINDNEAANPENPAAAPLPPPPDPPIHGSEREHVRSRAL